MIPGLIPGIACRIVLGLVLLAAGALKLVDPTAFRDELLGDGLPLLLSRIVAGVLPPFEILVGLGLLVWRDARPFGLQALALCVVFMAADAFAWWRGSASCGCFGADARIAPQWSLLIAVVLAAMAVWLLRRPRSNGAAGSPSDARVIPDGTTPAP